MRRCQAITPAPNHNTHSAAAHRPGFSPPHLSTPQSCAHAQTFSCGLEPASTSAFTHDVQISVRLPSGYTRKWQCGNLTPSNGSGQGQDAPTGRAHPNNLPNNGKKRQLIATKDAKASDSSHKPLKINHLQHHPPRTFCGKMQNRLLPQKMRAFHITTKSPAIQPSSCHPRAHLLWQPLRPRTLPRCHESCNHQPCRVRRHPSR